MTPDQIKRGDQLLEQGYSYAGAAKAIGIDKDTAIQEGLGF